jgi:hypothetical protein
METDSGGTLNELGNLRLFAIIDLSLPKVIGLSFLHLVTMETDSGGTLNELGNLRLFAIIDLSLPKVIGLYFLHLVTVETRGGQKPVKTDLPDKTA